MVAKRRLVGSRVFAFGRSKGGRYSIGFGGGVVFYGQGLGFDVHFATGGLTSFLGDFSEGGCFSQLVDVFRFSFPS